jgi:hypothetical protein
MSYSHGAQDGEARVQLLPASGLLDAWPRGVQVVQLAHRTVQTARPFIIWREKKRLKEILFVYIHSGWRK